MPPSRPPRSPSPATALASLPRNSKFSLAVTGGIGAGKSEALAAFERRGVPVRSSDEIVHRLIAHDPKVRAALTERWGTTDRWRIAGIVFADRDELEWLEGLLHPRVQREYEVWRAQLDDEVAVVEIPLLYETGSDGRFDAVVVITAPAEVRAARARVRPDERAKRLLPEEEKVRRATYAYRNDGTLEQLDAFVARVLADVGAART